MNTPRRTKKVAPGSIWMELALWLIFFPAGLIYSIWRITNKKEVEV